MIIINVVYDWHNVDDFNFIYDGEYITFDKYLSIRKNVSDADVTMCLTDMYADAKILKYLLNIFNGVDVRSN